MLNPLKKEECELNEFHNVSKIGSNNLCDGQTNTFAMSVSSDKSLKTQSKYMNEDNFSLLSCETYEKSEDSFARYIDVGNRSCELYEIELKSKAETRDMANTEDGLPQMIPITPPEREAFSDDEISLDEMLRSSSASSMESSSTPSSIEKSPCFKKIDISETSKTDKEKNERRERRKERISQKQEQICNRIFSYSGSLRSYIIFYEEKYFQKKSRIKKVSERTKEDQEEKQKRRKKYKNYAINKSIPITVLFFENSLNLSLDSSIALYKITEQSLLVVFDFYSEIFQIIWKYVDPIQILQQIFGNFRNDEDIIIISDTHSSEVRCYSSSSGSEVTNIKSPVDYKISSFFDSSSGSPLSPSGASQLKHLLPESLTQRIQKQTKNKSMAKVLSYVEHDQEDFVPTETKERIQRIMHYNISLKPFVATVLVNDKNNLSSATPPQALPKQKKSKSTHTNQFPSNQQQGLSSTSLRSYLNPSSHHSSTDHSKSSSPFMCTPNSFPPTPSSRSLLLARTTRFAEDILFLARDHLRTEENRKSEDARTRSMANALKNGCRFAIWNALDTSSSIALTCGQHVATKVVIGREMYSNCRSMVPLLRNCFVYFQISFPTGNLSTPANASSASSMAIGLSSLEMPLNSIVGAWSSSIGFTTTGQMLISGNWSMNLMNDIALTISREHPMTSVGCLVYIDDDTACKTQNGIFVDVSVALNMNLALITPSIHRRNENYRDHILQFLLSEDQELYPTVSFHSLGSQAICHFCKEDITSNILSQQVTHQLIGAPDDMPVYCLDGSVLLEAKSSEHLTIAQEFLIQSGIQSSFLISDDESSYGDDSSYESTFLSAQKAQYTTSL